MKNNFFTGYGKGMVIFMNLFFDLTGYEIKKIICRRRTVIVLTLVILLGALSVFGTLLGSHYYPDGNGGEVAVSNYEAEMTERRDGEALSGRVIDADLIMEAVEAFRQVPLNGSEYYFYTPEYQNIAKKYVEIYDIVSDVFQIEELEEFQQITREQAEQFDTLRRENMENVIANSDISENMRGYWKKCLDKTPETLTYEYTGGYYRFVAIMYTTAIMAGAAIAVMISGIFSEEYTSGADNLILSSKHGKRIVIGAKLLAAFGIAAVLVILLTVISYVEAMSVWGTQGANAPLELMGMFPYPLTVAQSALMYFVCILAACLFFTAVTMLFSAGLKAPFNTVVIMSVILIGPMFLSVPDNAPIWLLNLKNLLPTNMMAFWGAMSSLQYEVFGIIIPPYVFLPVFSVLASCVCSLFAYRFFKRHQVA